MYHINLECLFNVRASSVQPNIRVMSQMLINDARYSISGLALRRAPEITTFPIVRLPLTSRTLCSTCRHFRAKVGPSLNIAGVRMLLSHIPLNPVRIGALTDEFLGF